MLDFEYLPIVIVAALIFLSLARYRLVKAVQPLRLELAEKGEHLLARPELSGFRRKSVETLLNTAFNNRMTLIAGVFIVPLMAIFMMLCLRKVQEFFKNIEIADPELKAMYTEVVKLHDRITLANHPILLLLLEFEILVFIPPALIVGSLIRGIVPKSGDRDAVMLLIEAAEAKLSVGRKAAA